MPRLKATLVMLSLATASVPATLVAQSTYGAVPGSLQFVQGQANVDGQPIDTSKTNIAQPRQLHTGETLATANGSADILLAPGALLRVGQDSTVRMVAEDPNRTEVRLEQGRANISVNLVRDHDLLLLDTQNGQTQILSRGLYTFNTATNTLRVFNGEAKVFPGADTTTDVKPVKVKESHELILGADRTKPASFDRETADADLLPWTGPKETRAALADASLPRNAAYTNASYGGDFGFYDGYPGYAYAGYPYGFGPWGPYGFWGYPFFGVGFGFGGGFYGGYGGYGYGGYPIHGPYRGPVGPIRGGYGSRGGGSFGGGHAFAGGGFHGGGGGGFHGGGGGRR